MNIRIHLARKGAYHEIIIRQDHRSFAKRARCFIHDHALRIRTDEIRQDGKTQPVWLWLYNHITIDGRKPSKQFFDQIGMKDMLPTDPIPESDQNPVKAAGMIGLEEEISEDPPSDPDETTDPDESTDPEKSGRESSPDQ